MPDKDKKPKPIHTGPVEKKGDEPTKRQQRIPNPVKTGRIKKAR